MARRRTAAGLAALVAITGALVFGGATVANADLVINFTTPSSPSDGSVVLWDGNPVMFTGTTTDQTPTATIDVMDYSSGGSPDPMCVGIDPTSGTWSCEWSFSSFGAKDIRVFQNSGANSDQLLFTYTLPAPVVTGPSLVPAGGTVNLTGTNGYPFGATISAAVTTPSLPALTCGPQPVSTDGTWTCDIPFDAELAPDTDATVTVTQVYPGATSQVTHTFHVAAAPPATVTLDTPAAGQTYTWDGGTFATVNGRAPLGNPVDVEIDGTPVPACTGLPVDSFGFWDCGSLNLDIGPHTVLARQVTATDSKAIDVLAPAPDVDGLPLTGVEYEDEFHISGSYGMTSEPYSVTVTLYDGLNATDCWSPVDPTYGYWDCYLDLGPFVPGTYTLSIVQRPWPYLDTTIHSVTGSVPITIVPYGSTPATLNCTFTPGGASISSPILVDKYVRAIYENQVDSSFDEYRVDPRGNCGGSGGYPTSHGQEFDTDTVEDCGFATCSLSGLAPGLYDVWYQMDDSVTGTGFSYEPFHHVFRVPEAPAISSAVGTTNSVLLRGTGTVGDLVRIVRPGGSTMCSTTVAASGKWACAFPKSTTASARALAIDPSSGGMSVYTASRSIPIATAPVQDEDTPTLANWFLEFGGDLSNLKPGDKFTLNVSGMPVGTEIEIWMHSTPVLLGTATGTGAPMALNLQVPMDIESGPHEIQMVAVTPLGTHYFYTSDAHVLGESSKPLDSVEDPKGSGATGGTGGGSGDHNDPGGASGISGTIAPLQVILANPSAMVIAGGLALALLFLVALPTELLNSSLSSNTTRLGRVYGTIDNAMTRAQNWLIKVTHSRALVAILLVAIVAFVYGFVDPQFGFNIVSLRLVLSLAIAFFLLSFVASALSRIVIQRLWGAMAVVAIQPSIILFAILGVIVARILDFSPGFLVGVAIGLELIQASKRVAARAVFVQIAFVVGLSLVAWIVYSFFTPGNDFFGMLLEDTMVATTAEGLTGALIAVFPLKFLDGRELWEVSKRLWAAAFLIVGTAFALLVLPTAIAGTNVTDYVTWLIVFAVFGGLSFAVWLIFVRADKKASPAEKEKVDA
jgi:hypothetical protein